MRIKAEIPFLQIRHLTIIIFAIFSLTKNRQVPETVSSLLLLSCNLSYSQSVSSILCKCNCVKSQDTESSSPILNNQVCRDLQLDQQGKKLKTICTSAPIHTTSEAAVVTLSNFLRAIMFTYYCIQSLFSL